MLDPVFLLEISRESELIAADLHDRVLRQLLARLMARLGDEYAIFLTGTDKWQLASLDEAGLLLTDIQKEIATSLGLERTALANAFRRAGIESVRYDDAVYRSAGIATQALPMSPQYVRILERGFLATMGEWKNFTRTTALETCRFYLSACDKAYNAVMLGAESYSSILLEILKEAAEEDMIVQYPPKKPGKPGHRDTLEVACLRAVRTGINQTASNITAVRATENGITLFLTSAHIGARPEHFPWQGKVFWVDWDELKRRIPLPAEAFPVASADEKAKYPEFCRTTDIGTVTGLCGANCRHSYMPYVEGVSHNPFEQFDSDENKKTYDLSQEQRYKERTIRKYKRKLMYLETAVGGGGELETLASPEYQRTLAKTREKVADYYAFCEENGLKPQEFRLATP